MDIYMYSNVQNGIRKDDEEGQEENGLFLFYFIHFFSYEKLGE